MEDRREEEEEGVEGGRVFLFCFGRGIYVIGGGGGGFCF